MQCTQYYSVKLCDLSAIRKNGVTALELVIGSDWIGDLLHSVLYSTIRSDHILCEGILYGLWWQLASVAHILFFKNLQIFKYNKCFGWVFKCSSFALLCIIPFFEFSNNLGDNYPKIKHFYKIKDRR